MIGIKFETKFILFVIYKMNFVFFNVIHNLNNDMVSLQLCLNVNIR